ncbi:MAG: hypothetical protein QOD35_3152 [Nocardioidaceae bacterium]|nr:hypothetical protein [Nocardioidaceae bacterium]
MTDILEDRVVALEKQVAALTAAVEVGARRSVEPFEPYPARHGTMTTATATGRIPADLAAGETAPLGPMRPARVPPLVVAARREPFDLEELLGGRLLALVGGVAVIIGIAFFVALAINSGWIDENARVLLAGAGSLGLFAAGTWLYERRGRSQAALAMAATGITCAFLTLSAATVVYEVIPRPVALPLALGIGAVATAVALRWDARTVAALGIGGTVLSPLLDGTFDATSMALLAVAAGSAAAVMVWKRWPWLAVGVSTLTLAQVSLWAAGPPADAKLLGVLCVFAALNLALTLGYELRDSNAELQPCAVVLVPFGALVLGALGYYGLPHGPGELAGGTWLVALAAGHALTAAGAVLLRRASDEIVLVLLGAAVVLADVAFGSLGNGWVLGVGWAASSLGFAVVARRSGTRSAEVLRLTLGGQIALAVGHVLLFDARPQLLVEGHLEGAGAAGSVVAVLVAAFAAARLVAKEGPVVRVVLDSLSIAALAYITALTLDGSTLLLAWAASAVALARAADALEDRVAAVGAVGFLGLISLHLLLLEAPPSSLVLGVDSSLLATVALALAAGVAVIGSRLEQLGVRARPALLAVAAVALLYLGSVLIVSAFQPDTGTLLSDAGGVREQGQALVSAFWGLCGISALWAGLRSDARLVRLAGLGLLCLAASKVFLYDLAALGSVYRVASFIVLGLVLLAAAFVHQRLRAKAAVAPPAAAA